MLKSPRPIFHRVQVYKQAPLEQISGGCQRDSPLLPTPRVFTTFFLLGTSDGSAE